MTLSAEKISDAASFSAFLNCYLREIDTGVWHAKKDWENQTGLHFPGDESVILELQLDKVETCLAIGATFRSSIGRHQFTYAFQQKKNQWSWQAIDSLSTILLLIDNIFCVNKKTFGPLGSQRSHSEANLDRIAQMSTYKMELISRVIESHQIMREYVGARLQDKGLDSCSFIESEQSLLFGHWLHPTPKSRQGIHSWQHKEYTPELAATFQLHFFSVDARLICENSSTKQSAQEIIKQILQHKPSQAVSSAALAALESKQRACIPVHPLQAQWLLHQAYIKQRIQSGDIEDLGQMGPHFSPTSSVRTLYCESLDFMVKLSIPVKITNSLRVNMQHELNAGLLVSKYLDKTRFFTQHPQFKFIRDPAFITVKLPGKSESGFETILRDNPFTTPKQARQQSLSIAALTQDPINPNSESKLCTLVKTIAENEQKTAREVSEAWFNKYWHAAIEPAIFLYDTTGVAIESHQQNALLELVNHYPASSYFRDNQGFYLSQTLKAKILQGEPELANSPELFYEDNMICDRFAYYLIVNQLFSVINRFAIDKLVSEHTLLVCTHRKLTQLLPRLTGVGKHFVSALLEKKHIPCKGNLLTRVQDLDELQEENELAVYTHIRNPFYDLSAASHGKKSLRNEEAYLESA